MAKKEIDSEEDLDIYSEEGREELEENDEIDELEEGFVEGYEEGEHQVKCAKCGVLLVDEHFVEEEIDEHHYRFCSSECASDFEDRINKKRR